MSSKKEGWLEYVMPEIIFKNQFAGNNYLCR